ncbi:hypothetical protein MRB53_020623 [Persea americana]|uniref:Uncharacterized protein n=1 Tax=Persea americana TaxID=3435 RepID=A0ACC2L1P7_PERAE|nr:hypothetical protein MRB53_020623 [Persea americana]
MRVQISIIEKGLEVSRMGAGILSKTSNIKSWGRSSRQVLELRLWQGKREGVEAGIIWLRAGAIFTEAGVAQRGFGPKNFPMAAFEKEDLLGSIKEEGIFKVRCDI